MKKLGILALALALVFMVAACGGSPSSSTPASSAPASSETASASAASASTQIPNPLVSYETVEEAEEALGFDCKTPQWLPEGYEQVAVATIDNTILEVMYEDMGVGISFRTGKTDASGGNISGDYNEYATSLEFEFDGIVVQAAGDAEDSWLLATWTEGDRSYAMNFGLPVNTETLEKIVVDVQ